MKKFHRDGDLSDETNFDIQFQYILHYFIILEIFL